jgi:hypothetical protein
MKFKLRGACNNLRISVEFYQKYLSQLLRKEITHIFKVLYPITAVA